MFDRMNTFPRYSLNIAATECLSKILKLATLG